MSLRCSYSPPKRFNKMSVLMSFQGVTCSWTQLPISCATPTATLITSAAPCCICLLRPTPRPSRSRSPGGTVCSEAFCPQCQHVKTWLNHWQNITWALCRFPGFCWRGWLWTGLTHGVSSSPSLSWSRILPLSSGVTTLCTVPLRLKSRFAAQIPNQCWRYFSDFQV